MEMVTLIYAIGAVITSLIFFIHDKRASNTITKGDLALVGTLWPIFIIFTLFYWAEWLYKKCIDVIFRIRIQRLIDRQATIKEFIIVYKARYKKKPTSYVIDVYLRAKNAHEVCNEEP